MTIKRFKKLKEALLVARKENKRVFSYEIPCSENYKGARSFIVCDWVVLFNLIEGKPIQDRCYYEIIDQDTECRLYADIEFSKLENPQIDGDRLTLELIEFINLHLKKMSSVNITDVLVLDSSTASKFSVHLIWNLKNHVFQNNSVCGEFMKQIINKKDYNRFMLHKDGKKISYIDESVYRIFSSFRLIYNSKRDKFSYLNVSQIDKAVNGKSLSKKQIFLLSLISKPYRGAKGVITRNEVDKAFGFTRSLSASSSSSLSASSSSSLSASSSSPLLRTFIGPRETIKQDRIVFHDLSDFEILNVYIKSQMKSSGTIKNVILFLKTGTLIYNFKNYRWCEKVGRRHSSNEVFFAVDFNMKCWHQSCFDTECRGYKTNKIPLPDIVASHFVNSVTEQLALYSTKEK
jgi:DNA-directed primase/polymerase protein